MISIKENVEKKKQKKKIENTFH